MTTYLLIGLILVLATYLVHRRRGRSGDETAAAWRPPLRPPPKAAPQPAAARAETPAAAHASREPLPAPRPAPPGAEPAPSWNPEETIVEPGWPLPGEITGGWPASPSETAPFPDDAITPVAVLEWEPPPEAPAPGDPGHPGVPSAAPPSAEGWDMPSLDDAEAAAAAAGPPLWVPGEVGIETPPSGDEDAAVAPWRDEASPGAVALEQSAAAVSAPPTTADEPPPIAWGPSTAMPESPVADVDPADAAAPGAGLVWADASPAPDPDPEASAPSVWEAVASFAGLDAEPDPATPLEARGAEPAEPATETPFAPDAEPTPVPAVAWEQPADAGDPFPSPGPPSPSVPAETPATILETLTPAPVWPPEGALEPPRAITTPDEPWSPPPAPITSPPVLAPGDALPFTRVCDRLGVTPRMLVLMRMLAETPRSVSEQAAQLGVSRPLVADLCARLERAGLARREPVATDRRRVRMTLTDAGHRLCDETAGTPGAESLETIVAGLSAGERSRLLARLEAEGPTA